MINAFKLDHANSKDINEIPISNGQFLCATDTGNLYFDCNDTRISFNDIIIVESKTELKKIPHLIPGKFYYIKDPDDPMMLFYNGTNLIGGSNKYVHPVYKVSEGSYRCVTVNKYGHVIAANNNTLQVDEGGTGCKTIEQIKELLNLPQDSNTDIIEIKERLDSIELSIQNVLNQINDIRLSYSDGEFYMSNETTSVEDGES